MLLISVLREPSHGYYDFMLSERLRQDGRRRSYLTLTYGKAVRSAHPSRATCRQMLFIKPLTLPTESFVPETALLLRSNYRLSVPNKT